MINRLEALLAQTSLVVTDTQKQQLVALVNLLHKWNKAYNLTSVRDPDDMLIKHIMDSLVVSPYLEGERFIDVGTGPGLPGLPLAIINPEKEFVLLDSLGKRMRFITQAIHELKLTNVTPVQSRVEEYLPEIKFDGVLSRAFASLEDMLHWCKHLPKQDGLFYALKGVRPTGEIKLLNTKFKLEVAHKLTVPELGGERHLIIMSEIK